MAQNEITTILSLDLKDNASGSFEKAAKSSSRYATSVERIQKSLRLQEVELKRGHDAMIRAKAAIEGAKLSEIRRIKATQDSITSLKQKTIAENQSTLAMDAANDEAVQGVSAVDRLVQSLRMQQIALRRTGEEAIAYRARTLGANEAQEETIRSLYRSIQAQKQHTQALSAGARQARYMRGMSGQLGHQIQDVAVQMQMGTNGLLVFAQQGSQVASLMGPSGPMIGAILAIGAAMSMAFIPQTEKASKVTRDYNEELKKIIEKTQVLTNVNRDAAAAMLAVEIASERKELKRLKDERQDAIKGIHMSSRANQLNNQAVEQGMVGAGSYAGVLKLLSMGMESFSGDLVTNLSTVQAYDARVNIATDSLNRLEEQLAAINRGENPFFKDSTDESTGAVEDFVASLKEKSETLGMTARELMTYEATQAMIRDGNWENAASIYNEIDAYFDRMEALKKNNEQNDSVVSSAEKLIKSYRDQIAVYGATDRQIAIYNAAQSMIADGNTENAQSVYGLINAYYDLVDAQNAASEQETKRLNLESNIESIRQSLLTEEQLYQESYAKRQQQLQEALQQKLVTEQEYAALTNELQAQSIERQLNDQLRLVGGFEGMKQMGVDAISAIIKEGASMSDVFKMIGRTIVDNVIDTIVDMGIEFVKQQMIQKSIEASSSATSIATAAATGTGIAAVMAPAAALTSLATGGANAIGAQAGMTSTMALSKAMSLLSFEGGGFTGTGPRSGGIDSRGGFLSILHPNETVIDHTKGQAMGGVTIVNNIDASGAGPEVDQKIVAAMEITSQQTVKQVQDLLRRQRLV